MLSIIQTFRKPLLMVIVALLSAVGGIASTTKTDTGKSISMAIDEKAAISGCVEIISETPKSEIVEAIKAEPISAVEPTPALPDGDLSIPQ